MKCIKMNEEGIDVCVTVNVKPIFMKKSNGDLKEELERLELERVLKYLGVRQEAAVAQEIANEFEKRKKTDEL
jgi:hypothetical protein